MVKQKTKKVLSGWLKKLDLVLLTEAQMEDFVLIKQETYQT